MPGDQLPAGVDSPRSAAVLLSNALGLVDLIEPAAAREPVRQMFRAAIEACVVSRTLFGKSVVYVLRLAQALVDESHRRQAGAD